MEQLTTEEINLIVESLLFSSCLEITDEWSDNDREDMLQIASKLQTPQTTLKNIEIHNLDNTASSFAKKVCDLFPHINIVPPPILTNSSDN